MPSRPHEPRLNRFPHLRYDNGHADGDTPTSSLPPYPADSQTGSADMEVNGPGSPFLSDVVTPITGEIRFKIKGPFRRFKDAAPAP